MTPLQQARAFQASELAARRARAEATGSGVARRPSISQMAAAFGGGGHNVRRGGGKSYARGAASRIQAMEIESAKGLGWKPKLHGEK